MRAVVTWAVEHPTLVNLIMVGLCFFGIVGYQVIPKEVFPDTALDMIMIRVPYRGAGPTEVEKGIVLKIEEAVQQVNGIEQVTAESMENLGFLRVEVSRGTKAEVVLREIKDQIEQITGFPQDAERPVAFEMVRRVPVVQLALYGKASRQAMQEMSQKIKDELLVLPQVSQVTIEGYKQPEISIEIDESRLRQYGLQVADVGRAVLRANLDLSGGMFQTKREDLLIRVYGKRILASQLARIPIRAATGGTPIRLEDIARVRERFEQRPDLLYFNGRKALLLTVLRSSTGNALEIAKHVHGYLKTVNARLPKNIKLDVYIDRTIDLRARLSLLTSNGLQGLILVLLILTMFMNLRLAFWVAMGLPLSLLGTICLMYMTGTSINMISMFGMILVIGILVDDAIVIGENVYSHIEQGSTPYQAAIDGTVEVLPAVFAAVFTTILAFIPLFFLGGRIGTFIGLIPAVVIMCLSISLIESVILLPPHLAQSLRPHNSATYTLSRWRRLFDGAFVWLNLVVYIRSLKWLLRIRWVVLAGGIACMLLCVGMVRGGMIRFVFFPQLDGDRIVARFMLRPGTPQRESVQVARILTQRAREVASILRARHKQEVILHSLANIGVQSVRTGDFSPPSGEEVGEVQLELITGEQRKVTSQQVISMWRKQVGSIANLIKLSFEVSDTPPVGRAIELQLQSNDPRQLQIAADLLKKRLLSFAGVSDFENDFTPGKREIRLQLKPLAHSLGISLQDVAQQLRNRVYGQEVMRIQRERDEVRVFVRYPRKTRQLGELQTLWIRADTGQEYPLSSLATWRFSRELQVIRRINRRQVMTLTANLDESKGNRQEIMASLRSNEMPKLAQIAPAVFVGFAGQGREQAKTFQGLRVAFPLALFGIFVVLVSVLKSYSQALVVMAMIPFGVVGAIYGHMLMGANLTVLSLFGIVGLSGVVINDSLVMVDAINRNLEKGMGVLAAVLESGQGRLRPVLSTTITTCIGLGPLLLEKSRQAQFLIPMAISLAFGVFFATLITLVLTPALVLVVNDMRQLLYWVRVGEWPTPEQVEPICRSREATEPHADDLVAPVHL